MSIGMYLMYALCNDVMDKDCVLDFKANVDGIELKLSMLNPMGSTSGHLFPYYKLISKSRQSVCSDHLLVLL